MEGLDEMMYEVDMVLRWRKCRIKNQTIRDFLTVWTGFLLEDASWKHEVKFSDHKRLQDDIDIGLVKEDI